jgi:hypothetical protein
VKILGHFAKAILKIVYIAKKAGKFGPLKPVEILSSNVMGFLVGNAKHSEWNDGMCFGYLLWHAGIM